MSFTSPQTPVTHIKTHCVNGIGIFYREAVPVNKVDAPLILLLHGFPSSSFQYRNLIPLLASKYHVIAPDFPGFGFTRVPLAGAPAGPDAAPPFAYTFDSIAKVIIDFTSALNLQKFAIYMFDYGAPVGFRLAVERPNSVTAIITQNGNAFVQGFGPFWDQVKVYWEDATAENRESLRYLTTFPATKSQYTTGEASPESIPPETYYLDQALMDRKGNADIQLDLLYDYRRNIDLYPLFHEYLRKNKPPLLAVWGKNDTIFIPPGAEAYRTVLPEAEVHFIDGGHFVLENHLTEVEDIILRFLDDNL
ncbi:alpha/beta-hydrolase [Agrocybe pediades]|nr:alpha/beta-hydrolase [Agrocybe pediades]